MNLTELGHALADRPVYREFGQMPVCDQDRVARKSAIEGRVSGGDDGQ